MQTPGTSQPGRCHRRRGWSSLAARRCTIQDQKQRTPLLAPPAGADRTGMLPTWVFQRGGEQVMLHCRETGRGVTLVVSGDDDLRSYTFHDFAALAKFETEMADFLIGTGWMPAQLTVSPAPVPSLPPLRPPPTNLPRERR